MVQPWADQPFPLVHTSKVTGATGSKDGIFISDGMASIHNILIRGLNSMYLQAPYVTKEQDIQDLLQYAIFWEILVHEHHQIEETTFFPEIERVTEEKGIMERNVEQHHLFEPGLKAWNKWCIACFERTGSEKFNVTKFKQLIDDFAPALVQHLADEIPTLLSLDKYDMSGIRKAWDKWDAHMQSKADKWTTYPLALGSIDWSYEGADKFPNLPFFVPYVVHYVFGRKYRSVWRFNPNTLFGERRPLHFLPPGGAVAAKK